MYSIKIFSVSVLLILFKVSAIAQTDSLVGSFENIYKRTNPTLKYSYDSIIHIHNYSDNWDLDNDGKNDGVYFVKKNEGTFYYYLRVVLSSNKKTQNFFFLEMENPIFPTEYDLNRYDYNPQNYKSEFAVLDLDNDGIKDIFIRLNASTYFLNQKILEKNDLKNNRLVITFKNSKVKISDFKM